MRENEKERGKSLSEGEHQLDREVIEIEQGPRKIRQGRKSIKIESWRVF